ncbi:MAG: hypothetical protein AB1716_12760 [Planctomycetota bacterium]
MPTVLTARATAALLLSLLLATPARTEDKPQPVDPGDYTEFPELWTCGAEDWGPWYATCVGTDDRPATGKYSVVLNYCSGAEHYFAFPKFRNADWDLTGAEYLEFKVRFPKGITHRGPNPRVYLRSTDGPFIRVQPKDGGSLFEQESDGQWQSVRVPLKEDPQWETFHWLRPSLKHIDCFEVSFCDVNVPKWAAHHVLIDGVCFGPVQPAYTPPDVNAADLDVLIIERTPTYKRFTAPDYDGINVMQVDNRDAKHYPDQGEVVTFTARVQNKGRSPAGGNFVWLLDGKEVARGELPELAPRGKAHFEYRWPWDPADHDLTFQLTPGADDYCARNNALTIRNNALMWKHVIERGTLAEVEQKTNMIGSYSFEDWLQGQARFMNQLCVESKYPQFPDGITARVMIGKFEYVDDNYVEDVCKIGPFRIGELDPNYDGGRGCTLRERFWDTGRESPCYLNFLNFQGRPDGAWLHEMSHQNGIIDDYQFITEPDANLVNGVGFNYANRGLMGGGEIYPHKNPDQLYSRYAPGDVHAYNVTKGKRRGYFGEYLYCMAKNNTLLIKDVDGQPVANAEIRVYQTHDRRLGFPLDQDGQPVEKPAPGEIAPPDHAGRTDAQGRFPLPNRKVEPAVTETGCELHDNPFGKIHVVGFNGVFLVVVQPASGPELYGFTTIQEFNLAWAAGQKDQAEITVSVKVKGDEKWWTAPPPK